jgi:hypothetical protein
MALIGSIQHAHGYLCVHQSYEKWVARWWLAAGDFMQDVHVMRQSAGTGPVPAYLTRPVFRGLASPVGD